jgi:hypothetical protein
LVVDSTSQTIIAVANGVIVSGPGAIIVSEGWERSFSSSIGVAGQNKKTQVIFQVIGLPDNVSLTFPGTVLGDTGAALVTLSGGSEALTNQSKSNRVVYEFNASAISQGLIDSFSITPTVDLIGTPGTGTVAIQAALGPIGSAVPDSTSAPPDIPRFAELFLPSSLPGPVIQTTTLRLTVPRSIDDQQITISNTTSGGAVATVRARREDGALSAGANFTNEVARNFPSLQTTTLSLKDLFGAGASAAGVSAIEIESQNNGLVINGIGTVGVRRFGNGPMSETTLALLPFDRRTSSVIPLLTVHNTSASDGTAIITARTSAGNSVASVQRTIASLGAVRETFSTLFPSASLPLEGYITVSSSVPVRSLLLTSTDRPDETPTVLSTATSPLLFPFFAFGNGFSTVVELTNPSDSQAVRVILSAFSANGSSLSAQPLVRILAPSERQNFDFATIFALGSSGLTAGYFSLTLESTTVTNPFASPPQVAGVVRIGTDTQSAIIPVSLVSGTKFHLTPAAETASTWTGLSILNTTTAATSITVDAFSGTGAFLGSSIFNLNGNNARIQLLRELLPQSLVNENVLVRVTSTPGAIKVIGFRGLANSNELIYLRGETTP